MLTYTKHLSQLCETPPGGEEGLALREDQDISHTAFQIGVKICIPYLKPNLAWSPLTVKSHAVRETPHRPLSNVIEYFPQFFCLKAISPIKIKKSKYFLRFYTPFQTKKLNLHLIGICIFICTLYFPCANCRNCQLNSI